ncbi:MAG TPA: sporulation integral membrane protein YtvI [Ruminococcaceae bacterium]|nr:sporulation integral membrane protein YtvI [Oscillospiraceae bacterium]
MNRKENYTPRTILQNNKKVEKRFCFLINLLYFSVLLAIGIVVARYLFLWMLPFVMALVVAASLQRPIGWLVNKTKISKNIFSVVLVVLFVLLLAGLVAIIGWQLMLGIITFVTDKNNIHLIEKTINGIAGGFNEFVIRFSDFLSSNATDTLQKGIDGISTSLMGFVTDLFANVATSAATAVTTSLPMLLVSFIIWVVASIFLTIDYQKVITFIMRQVPERHAETVELTRSLCTNTIFRLLRAYLLLMFITFIELSISFSILGVSYALLIAALVALVDILPVLGTGTILIPWAFIALIMGDFKLFIGLGITYIIITILRNILEPRVVSQQIGLNPLVTLFFMFLGLRAIGIFGMLLFPVIVMVLIQLQESGKIKIWK